MDLTQDITLRLTEQECREYVTELYELEGIADSLSPGGLNTETGLVMLHRIRDLFEAHGLGIRQRQLETGLAYRESLAGRGPAYTMPVPACAPLRAGAHAQGA